MRAARLLDIVRLSSSSIRGSSATVCLGLLQNPLVTAFLTIPVCICSRTLSQRVATYNQRVVGECDALAEEVRLETGRESCPACQAEGCWLLCCSTDVACICICDWPAAYLTRGQGAKICWHAGAAACPWHRSLLPLAFITRAGPIGQPL